MFTDISTDITRNVEELYERFPYPYYPLYFKPKAQEAYLSASIFSSRLISELTQRPAGVANMGSKPCVFVVGCGEMQPYIFSKWEPRKHKLCFLDLSQRNIFRARLRLGLHFKKISWIREDLCSYFAARKEMTQIDHCDVYGVLHHLASPNIALDTLVKHISKNGTLRIMIYNSHSRDWIHHFHKIFKIMSLSSYEREDLAIARHILQGMGKVSALKDKLAGMNSILKNDCRLVDTFFHSREIFWAPQTWLKLLKHKGLQAVALFDRYGELDDLPNPMWKFPSTAQILDRSLDRRFENNLEVFLVKKSRLLLSGERTTLGKKSLPLHTYMQSPPSNWFDFSETRTLSMHTRFTIWHCFLKHLEGRYTIEHEKKMYNIPLKSLQRLARIGAILPGMVSEPEIREKLLEPLVDHMDIPRKNSSTHVDISDRRICEEIFRYCRAVLASRKSGVSRRSMEALFQRLNKLI